MGERRRARCSCTIEAPEADYHPHAEHVPGCFQAYMWRSETFNAASHNAGVDRALRELGYALETERISGAAKRRLVAAVEGARLPFEHVAPRDLRATGGAPRLAQLEGWVSAGSREAYEERVARARAEREEAHGG